MVKEDNLKVKLGIRLSDRLLNCCIVLFVTFIPFLMLMLYPIEHVVLLTFFVKIIILSFLLWMILSSNDKNVGNIFVFIFFYLFFLIAPIIQLGIKPILLVNTLPYNVELIFEGNVLTVLFLSIYVFVYALFNTGMNSFSEVCNYKEERYKYIVLFILVLLSVFAIFVAVKEMLNKTSLLYLLENQGLEEDISGTLIRSKILYNFPLAAFIYLACLRNIRYKNLYMLLILLMIFVTKNPLLEKRNGLGSTYLLVLYYFLQPYLKTSRRYFILYFFVFIVFFPLSAILTNSSFFIWMNGFGDYSLSNIIFAHFEQLHYDAWANFLATLDYVKEKGITGGYQLMGTIFFFVPRSLWNEKPYSTGTEVANYLIENYNMWFSNLSSPIQAEAYIDFGILGIFMYAVIIAFLSIYLGRMVRYGKPIYSYTAVYVAGSYIFILRGALMSAFAYTIGGLIAILIIPIMLEFFFRHFRIRS